MAERAQRSQSADGELSAEPMHEQLDELDRAIIDHLQEDGRRSYTSIARALEVPEGTVRFRARRLQEQGALRILAFTDPHSLGYEILASVLLRAQPRHHRRLVEELGAWPEVMYLSSCTGAADIYLHIVCLDHRALLELVTDRLGALDGIDEVETLIELEVHKARYHYADISQRHGD